MAVLTSPRRDPRSLPTDVELLLHELRRAGFEPHEQQMATEPDFLAQLAPPPDIILADRRPPQLTPSSRSLRARLQQDLSTGAMT